MPDIFPEWNEDTHRVIKDEVGQMVDQILNRPEGMTYTEARDEAAEDLRDRLMLYSQVEEVLR